MPAFPPVICFALVMRLSALVFTNALTAQKWEDKKDARRITLYETVTIAVHAEAP